MRGRKPIPASIHVLRNNPSKTGPRKDRVKPKDCVPDMPAHLPGRAAEEWRRLVPELVALGLLTGLDLGVLGGYCTSFARWVELEQAISAFGPVADLGSDEVLELTRLYRASDRAAALMLRFGAELGLSPSARERISAKPPAAGGGPGDAYFE